MCGGWETAWSSTDIDLCIRERAAASRDLPKCPFRRRAGAQTTISAAEGSARVPCPRTRDVISLLLHLVGERVVVVAQDRGEDLLSFLVASRDFDLVVRVAASVLKTDHVAQFLVPSHHICDPPPHVHKQLLQRREIRGVRRKLDAKHKEHAVDDGEAEEELRDVGAVETIDAVASHDAALFQVDALHQTFPEGIRESIDTIRQLLRLLLFHPILRLRRDKGREEGSGTRWHGEYTSTPS